MCSRKTIEGSILEDHEASIAKHAQRLWPALMALPIAR